MWVEAEGVGATVQYIRYIISQTTKYLIVVILIWISCKIRFIWGLLGWSNLTLCCCCCLYYILHYGASTQDSFENVDPNYAVAFTTSYPSYNISQVRPLLSLTASLRVWVLPSLLPQRLQPGVRPCGGGGGFMEEISHEETNSHLNFWVSIQWQG